MQVYEDHPIHSSALRERVQLLEDIRFAWVHNIRLVVKDTEDSVRPLAVHISEMRSGGGVEITKFVEWGMRLNGRALDLQLEMEQGDPVCLRAPDAGEGAGG